MNALLRAIIDRKSSATLHRARAIGIAAVCSTICDAGATAGRRLVISDISIIPLVECAHEPRATVVIEDGAITRIESPTDRVWVLGDELIRGQGLWLMPGLIDGCVTTIDPADLHVMSLAGTTSVVLAPPSNSAMEWLRPLAELPAAGLPRLLALPVQADLPPRSGLARSTAISRWRASEDQDRWLDLVEPATAEAWRIVAASAIVGAEISLPRVEADRALLSSWAGEPLLPPDRAMFDELSAVVATGATAAECLRAATRGAADALCQPRLGRIAVGASADLVLLEGDPRVDLHALRRVRAVILRGQVLRAAQRESTLDLLRELRRDEERGLRGPALGPDSRRWLVRFDGLPRGLFEASPAAEGQGTTRERRSMWSPLRSVLDIAMTRSAAGKLESARMEFTSPAGDLVAAFDRGDAGWSLTLAEEVDAPEVRRTKLALGEISPDAVFLMDLWPSVHDLRSFSAVIRQTRRAHELIYGSGPLALAVREIRTVPWSGVRAPGVLPVASGADALARSVAASPWRPTSVYLFSMMESGVPPGVGSVAVSPSWWRAQHPLMVGAIGVDGDGWPLVGRFAVPEGLWEFHPPAEGVVPQGPSP